MFDAACRQARRKPTRSPEARSRTRKVGATATLASAVRDAANAMGEEARPGMTRSGMEDVTLDRQVSQFWVGCEESDDNQGAARGRAGLKAYSCDLRRHGKPAALPAASGGHFEEVITEQAMGLSYPADCAAMAVRRGTTGMGAGYRCTTSANGDRLFGR